MVTIDRILEMLENNEFKSVEYREVKGSFIWFYDIITNNGGTIRFSHENKVLFSKETISVSAFVPYEQEAILHEKFKSDDAMFKRVYDVWNKIRAIEENRRREEYSKYF